MTCPDCGLSFDHGTLDGRCSECDRLLVGELCPRCGGEGHLTVNPDYPNPETEVTWPCGQCGTTGLVEHDCSCGDAA